MNLKLVIYSSKEDTRFKKSAGAFVLERNYNQLRSKIGLKETEILYATIECKNPLCKFKTLHQIDVINKQNYVTGDDQNIFVHNSIVGDILDSGNLNVEIKAVDINTFPLASKIIIKLQEKEVAKWAADESKQAINTIRTKNSFLIEGKPITVNPITKSSVIGKVEKYFSNEDNRNELNAFRLDRDTVIELEGLPALSQKVIEFQKIGGLDETINRLREIIQLPLNHSEMFERFAIRPYRGILLYGPPGNGKTLIGQEIANSLRAKFISIAGSELMSSQVSVGERKLTQTFEEASESGNCIIFIDELDAIAINRDNDSPGYEVRFGTTLLNLMNGVKEIPGVFVIGATNRLHAVDPAFRRPGRFDLEFEIPLPDADNRFDIFKIYAKNANHIFEEDVSDAFVKQLCDNADGYSGADLAGVYRESVMNAIRRHLQFDELGKSIFSIDPLTIKISKCDLQQAFENFKSYAKRIIEVK